MNANQILNITIPLKAHQYALQTLRQHINLADTMTDPVGLAIVGPSGSGKSMLLDELQRNYQNNETDEGIIIPFVRVQVPSQPTVKGLVEAILFEYDQQRTSRATEQRMTYRVRTLMTQCRTIVLALDEFQHFYDLERDRIWRGVTDWLKTLMNIQRCVVLVAGLPYGMGVVLQNEQLRRRFRAQIKMPHYRWETREERIEFQACLRAFSKAVARQYQILDVTVEENAFKYYVATGGIIGNLKTLLHEAIVIAQEHQINNITAEILNEAHKRYLFCASEIEMKGVCPFSEEFSAVSNSEALSYAADIIRPRYVQKGQPHPVRVKRTGSTFISYALNASDEERISDGIR